MAKAGAAAKAADTGQGKVIALFSDGTGNSSGKLFKTNVWRMYEALDLGPMPPGGGRLQIAYYDNGVGTSNFRPLALLGGIFGFGLKAGVLRLYSYLARNYQPGDSIYIFGFSRGAFTVRLLAGLISSQGVVRYENETELARLARAAYREFCREFWPNRRPARLVAKLTRAIRDGLMHVRLRISGQTPYARMPKAYPDIAFLGVWDTVAAYGGPFAEVTRGIDDWIWPLTMPNYGLTIKVRRASHALALDDERDAFQPLLWDEVREQSLVRKGEYTPVIWQDGEPHYAIRKAPPGRLNQVWFTGMHSDVGGGYPDESLSYVSLLWMMDEAVKGVPQGERLRFLSRFTGRAGDLSNPFGPIHNSRAGLGAYYRYQPRKIAASLDPVTADTRALRDPEVSGRDPKGRRCPQRGLLTRVKVHESVIARIEAGNDRYAPVTLPGRFEIVSNPPDGLSRRCLPAGAGARYVDPVRATLRAEAQEDVWDDIWYRRKLYFFTLGVSLLLIAFPALQTVLDAGGLESLCSDDRCFAARPITWLDQFMPGPVKIWTASYAKAPVSFLLLVTSLMILLARGRARERALLDHSWDVWRRIKRDLPAAQWPHWSPTRLTRVRTSRAYQSGLQRMRWTLLPLLSALAMAGTAGCVLAAIVTQVHLVFAEARGLGCDSPPPSRAIGAPVVMKTSSLCTPLATTVRAGARYRIALRVTTPWRDGGPASPAYDAAPDSAPKLPVLVDVPGQALRRAIGARWMEPLVRIRFERGLFGHGAFVSRLALVRDAKDPSLYTGVLEARRDGEASIFVNDAILPGAAGLFYRDNEGEAQVSLEEIR